MRPVLSLFLSAKERGVRTTTEDYFSLIKTPARVYVPAPYGQWMLPYRNATGKAITAANRPAVSPSRRWLGNKSFRHNVQMPDMWMDCAGTPMRIRASLLACHRSKWGFPAGPGRKNASA
jgi:hypothetical protein